MTAAQNPGRLKAAIGDFDPKLAEMTDDVLYGDIWERPQLSKRDRSLVTVAALIALNRPEQLRSHLLMARKKRGDAGRASRDYHPPGVLLWLAERGERHRRCQGSFQHEVSFEEQLAGENR